jgi:hypothetical protein
VSCLCPALSCLCCSNILEEEYKQLRDDLNVMRMEVLTHGNGGINIPVNLRRLIWNAQNEYNCGPNKVPPPGELRAVDVVQRIRVSALLLLLCFCVGSSTALLPLRCPVVCVCCATAILPLRPSSCICPTTALLPLAD